MVKRRRRYSVKQHPSGKSFAYGLFSSIMISVVVLLLWSIIMSLTTVSDATIRVVVIITIIVSIFAGGFVSAKMTRQKGWIIGGFVGVIYLVILLFMGSAVSAPDLSLTAPINLIFGFIVGAIGGVMALNL
ncbi:TIGR04086 family membrane protein [Proteinivorax hydrogeniformans]|uniref:TIGR04086 family membrane protein n=1 Tax=Proteinivorax hydrogeniformans TaxID=1826727 RepID=A0AAU8HRI4_9FIRM